MGGGKCREKKEEKGRKGRRGFILKYLIQIKKKILISKTVYIPERKTCLNADITIGTESAIRS